MHIRFSCDCKNKSGISININVSLPVDNKNDFTEAETKMFEIIQDMGLTLIHMRAHQYSSSGNLVTIWK